MYNGLLESVCDLGLSCSSFSFNKLPLLSETETESEPWTGPWCLSEEEVTSEIRVLVLFPVDTALGFWFCLLVRNPFLIAGSFGFASSPRLTTELELAGGRGGGRGREEAEDGGILFLAAAADAADDDDIESPDEEIDV